MIVFIGNVPFYQTTRAVRLILKYRRLLQVGTSVSFVQLVSRRHAWFPDCQSGSHNNNTAVGACRT
eukprot:SAG31_NODE_685_length_12832_cov_28.355376_1_plen_66_part_00